MGDWFKKMISFTDSTYFLNEEASMFKHTPQFEIGFGAKHGMDNPLDS